MERPQQAAPSATTQLESQIQAHDRALLAHDQTRNQRRRRAIVARTKSSKTKKKRMPPLYADKVPDDQVPQGVIIKAVDPEARSATIPREKWSQLGVGTRVLVERVTDLLWVVSDALEGRARPRLAWKAEVRLDP